jgi:hypothetical protein
VKSADKEMPTNCASKHKSSANLRLTNGRLWLDTTVFAAAL